MLGFLLSLSFFHLGALAAKMPKLPPPPKFERCGPLLPSDPAARAILTAMQKPLPVHQLTIPLEPYLNSLGLGEHLMDVIPIKTMDDVNLSGQVDPSQIRKVPSGMYPLESFAISDTARTVAMTIHRTYVTDEDHDRGRSRNLFVARVDDSKLALKHIAEIDLPHEAHALGAFFADGDRYLVVEGVTTRGDSFTSDLYFYDLSSGRPRLLHNLSQKVGKQVKRISRIASPIHSSMVLAVELVVDQGETNFAAVRVNLKPQMLLVQVLVEAIMTSRQLSRVEQMEFDDDRRGYMNFTNEGVRFQSGNHLIDVYARAGAVREQDPITPKEERRSFYSAWLSSTRTPGQLRIASELGGGSQVFRVPDDLDFGSIAEIRGGFVYEERNEPNYRLYLLRNGRAELLSSNRLIHTEIHANFVAGTTGSRGSEPDLEIFHLK